MEPMSNITVTDSPAYRILSSITNSSVLPREMVFSEDNLVSMVIYGVLLVIAAIGNLTVFVTLCRNKKRRSRVNLFILHLSVADLIVTFVMMPLEIGWHATVAWKAGDAGCRVFMFCRTFGFYLSSFILIAISLDRYFSITRPFSLNDAGSRGKLMLMLAWLFSIIASIPQSVIFHQEQHPDYAWFYQCVTFHFFPSSDHELAYNLFNIFVMYLIPLVTIIACYSLILVEISRRSGERLGMVEGRPRQGCTSLSQDSIRRSGGNRIQKAKMNTLKMTIVIVAVFIICWTPYFVILAWWWFDPRSAQHVNKKIQRGLFIFAVSNSCVNPIVYGMFSTVFRRHTLARRLCSCMPWTRRKRARQLHDKVHAPPRRYASRDPGRHDPGHPHVSLREFLAQDNKHRLPFGGHAHSETGAIPLQQNVPLIIRKDCFRRGIESVIP